MKKLLAITISLVMSVSLFGCQSNNTQETNKTEQSSSEVNSNEQNENPNSSTVVIEHSGGKVEVPKNPSKIAVFDMGILDILNTLGVDVEITLPVQRVPKYLEQYKDVTNAGEFTQPDIESLFNFEPEIIFITKRQAEYYDELNKIAPTIYVDLNSKTYMDDFTRNVTYLAEIFGKEEEAKAELEKINSKVEEIKKKANETDEKALIIMTKENKISAFGSDSRFGMIHDILDVKQADEKIEVSTHGKEVSYEYIAEVNPDILYVVDRSNLSGEGEFEKVSNNEFVKQTTASKMGKVIYLEPEFWYISSGGLTSVYKMLEEVENSLN